MISENLKNEILKAQRNEITEYHLYTKLAQTIKSPSHKQILQQIAAEEKQHYYLWRNLSNTDVKPNKLQLWVYYLIIKILGVNFGVRLMEKGESEAQKLYHKLKQVDANLADRLIQEESEHEAKIISMIDQQKLAYTGSIVLGLNDALVELSGALAGLTFALQNTHLIALVGLITGIAASLSMAASEYLSTKEEGGKNPIKASIYTGLTYIGVVIFLVAPYFITTLPFLALSLTLAMSIIIIFSFTYYISVAKGLPFTKRFIEMAGISLGIAVINFVIGLAVRWYFGIDA